MILRNVRVSVEKNGERIGFSPGENFGWSDSHTTPCWDLYSINPRIYATDY